MARGDFKLRTQLQPEFTASFIVPSGGATTILSGEPTKRASATGAAGTGVEILADAEPTTADGKAFAGMAKTDSTDTAAAAGVVTVWLPLPGIIYSGKPKTAGTCNTQAKLDVLMLKRVIFDLTSTAWGVDTAATDAAANGIVIVGGDYQTDMVFFMVSPGVTVFGVTA